MANNFHFGGQNVGSSWGPPSGMAGLIAQDRANIGRGGQMLGQAMKDMAGAMDKFKVAKENAKAADLIYKNNPEAAQRLAVSPDEWATLGAQEKAGRVASLMKAQGQAEMMEQYAEAAARRKATEQVPAALGDLNDLAQAAKLMGKQFDPQMALGAVAGKFGGHVLQDPSFRDAFAFYARQADPLEQRKRELEERRLSVEEKRVEAYSQQVSGGGAGGAAERSVEVTEEAGGRQVKRKMTPDEYDAMQANGPEAARKRAEVAKLQEELRQMESRVAGGDKRYGLANLKSRENRIRDIRGKLAELGADSPAAGTGGKTLDKETAGALLKEAGGDKAKARELARQRGYTF